MSYPYGEPLTSKSQLVGRDSVDLLARMIYAEAEAESYEGKLGVAHVAKNRKWYNTAEFGGNTYEGVLLNNDEFALKLQPNLNSQAWEDSLEIASTMSTNENPIECCYWFNTTTYFNTRIRYKNGVKEYKAKSGTYFGIENEIVIGNHTFFLLGGY
jgi:spore germination cell wall hydrolase CwlJ-like protein